jgi:hypothetical protein
VKFIFKYDLSKKLLCVHANFILNFVFRRDKPEILFGLKINYNGCCLHTPVAVCYTKTDASSKIFFNTVANTGSTEVPFTEVHRQKERKKETNKQKTTAKERKQSRRTQNLQPFKAQ